MKIVERVLEKRVKALVEVDDMQFGFMPRRGMADVLFIVRRMQEEYRKKDKNCTCGKERTTKDLGEVVMSLL